VADHAIYRDHAEYRCVGRVPRSPAPSQHLQTQCWAMETARPVTQPPQRLSTVALAALCDILDCTSNDLISIEIVSEFRWVQGVLNIPLARSCGISDGSSQTGWYGFATTGSMAP
jgi:hypothetical protein